MIKVLQVNSKDVQGGAARAAYRLFKGLQEIENIQVEYWVQKKTTNEPDIINVHSEIGSRIMPGLKAVINNGIMSLQESDNKIFHSTNIIPTGLHRRINDSDADVVHLHWVNGGMISIKEISKINKPIVWTLHDMWAFSGAEHIDDMYNRTKRYEVGYTKANRPDGHKKIDIDRYVWFLKKHYWSNLDIQILTPSRWLSKCAEKSNLFKNNNVLTIPNGLDTKVFKPVDKKLAREILNLPIKKKLVLYGAIGGASNPLKGYEKLMEAKKNINENNSDIAYLVFGNDYKKVEIEEGVDTFYFGHINDDITLSIIYSAADVMVVPSFMEAFGQTASEAMACGTPIAAFGTTGLLDIVDHKINGYLVKPYDSQDLAKGINWILQYDYPAQLAKEARDKVLREFDSKVVANNYKNLYESLL